MKDAALVTTCKTPAMFPNYLATDYGLSFAYDTTTVVPEPASMGAIVTLATATLRRRRREACRAC